MMIKMAAQLNKLVRAYDELGSPRVLSEIHTGLTELHKQLGRELVLATFPAEATDAGAMACCIASVYADYGDCTDADLSQLLAISRSSLTTQQCMEIRRIVHAELSTTNT